MQITKKFDLFLCTYVYQATWYISAFSIMKKHAILSLGENDEYELQPAVSGAKTKVNGQPLTGPRFLNHRDRILFGRTDWTFVFSFDNDDEAASH